MEDCISKIKEAQIICIFGSSLGVPDSLWWALIIEKLRTDCLLIIFHKGKQTNPLLVSEKAIIENIIKNDFLSKSNIPTEEREAIDKKVIVVVNSNMFNIVKSENE
ncbi:MAG: hypothetical protein ACI8RP_000796 [Urechidicola sp.]|jgi:hypothetical protein